VISRAVLPYVWMLAGALAFASMGALAHALNGACPWLVVAIVRTALALVFAAGLALAAGAKLVFWRPGTLWLRSLAGSASLICTFYALPRLPLADVLTLTNIFPIWVALLSWPMLRLRPAPGVWGAVACGLAGVYLVQRPSLAGTSVASLAALASSLTTALAMIGLHRSQAIDVRAIVVHFSAVSLAICLVALAVSGEASAAFQLPNASTAAMLLALGVTATMGQIFQTKAFAAGPPAKVSVVGLAQVVFGMMYDVVVWRREFDGGHRAGACADGLAIVARRIRGRD
jgi:drug/metabolite transporter (DMT)-like permease